MNARTTWAAAAVLAATAAAAVNPFKPAPRPAGVATNLWAGTNGAPAYTGPVFSTSMELPPMPDGNTDDVQSMGDLTVVTSDRLVYEGQKGYALFERNVVVSDPQMKMKADKLTIFFEGTNEVKTILAEGRVIMSQADKMAWAGRATYDVAAGKIVLEDSPRVMRGRDMMLGERITFWRDQNKVECWPKARLIMYPDKNRKMDFLPGAGGKQGG